uniref:Uncharacterized protein n=1 Tax=Chromera velia CCMP2878 TaxID=1169474 RepID=A0A0G4I9R8_9ALVE|eukprot:Cvel_12238.t1-p1 / transcript=Cvel_12238.t1 / gene=Cvel_12238 / organism=Chromera_velia_CCMP2878 / gene_product=hypothetical protein / transcript_product=hypothetical protein / location=Cvel_scaffold792:60739-63038(+) / protein_length=269 / sequence_SO=supercontig / SO=protein_coding / is_pseudo=false
MLEPTARSKVRTGAKRTVRDQQAVEDILDAGFLAFVAFNRKGDDVDGAPTVLPTAYCRDGDAILLHGKQGSGLQKHIATQLPVCVCTAITDGVVMAKSGMHHSMNYRSVVIYGVGEEVSEKSAKVRALNLLTDRLTYEGRSDTLRPISNAELTSTTVTRLPLREVACKVRAEGVNDDAADLDWPCWAGVVPLVLASLPPVSAPQAGSLPPPSEAVRLERPGRGVVPVEDLTGGRTRSEAFWKGVGLGVGASGLLVTLLVMAAQRLKQRV